MARYPRRRECDASDLIFILFEAKLRELQHVCYSGGSDHSASLRSQNRMILTIPKHHVLRICNGVIILWSIFYLSSYWECYSRFAVQRYHFPSTCKSSYFWTSEGSRFSFRTTCTTFYSILLGIGWDTTGLSKTRNMKTKFVRAFGTANGCNKIVLWSVVHGVLDHAASMYGKSRFWSWSVSLSDANLNGLTISPDNRSRLSCHIVGIADISMTRMAGSAHNVFGYVNWYKPWEIYGAPASSSAVQLIRVVENPSEHL